MELKEGAVVANRFRLVRLLGQGGMGEVWAAQHTSLDIPCAVKFIHSESAEKPEVRERFEREAKAAAQLRSPNVVQILDYGVFEGTPYIAMEYLEGEPLNARLRRRARLDAYETFRIISQVAKALSKAHAAGIVHRDLKPENIFLVHDDDSETAKVLDFGVAKRTAVLDSNTRTGALLGTPFYMSPEQAQGIKAVDSRADLWSLAVLTYRCLVGELPFKSDALGDLLIRIVTQPLPIPSHTAQDLPEGFDAWWERAAQRDPNDRFQDPKEFTQALGLALGVSMPSALGLTPMPTSPAAASAVSAAQHAAAAQQLQLQLQQQQQLQQQVYEPTTAPMPRFDPASYAGSGGGAGGFQQPSVQQVAAGYPPPPAAPFPLAGPSVAGTATADTGSGASVAGIYTPAPVPVPTGTASKQLAVVGLIGALLLSGGGVAAFFLLTGPTATEAQPTAAATSSASSGGAGSADPAAASATATVATTASVASDGEGGAQGSGEGGTDPSAKATTRTTPSPTIKPTTTTSAEPPKPPRVPPTSPDPPKPPPKPKSTKPDLGF